MSGPCQVPMSCLVTFKQFRVSFFSRPPKNGCQFGVGSFLLAFSGGPKFRLKGVPTPKTHETRPHRSRFRAAVFDSQVPSREERRLGSRGALSSRPPLFPSLPYVFAFFLGGGLARDLCSHELLIGWCLCSRCPERDTFVNFGRPDNPGGKWMTLCVGVGFKVSSAI